MRYYKDLLRQPKKTKLAIVIGVLFFVLALAWIPVHYFEDEPIQPFDWFYAIILLVSGLVQLMAGLGFPIERLAGKTFIQIDEDVIWIKTDFFDKGQKVYWRDIQSLQYKMGKFYLNTRTNPTLTVSLSKIEYSDIQDIKSTIAKLAEKKNIPLEM